MFPFDLGKWRRSSSAAAVSNLFELIDDGGPKRLGTEGAGEKEAQISLKDALTAANPGRPRRLVMESFLKVQASQTLRLPSSDIDINKSFRAYGMDSLTALEYRNLVEAGTGLTLSATLVWNYPTIDQLTSYLAEKLDISIDTPDDERGKDDAIFLENELVRANEAALDELLNEVELLSDEETRQLLNGKS